jgi:hypothetical protein
LSADLSADEIIVGAVSGSTRLVLNDISASALPGVNIAGVTLIHGTSGTASNFTWAGERKGFVLYELEFNPTLVDWNLVGLPDQAGVQMLKAPLAGQDFWRHGADGWSDHEQQYRDSI